MSRVSILTATAAALIWVGSVAAPSAFAQGAGSAGSAGSQAGSSQGQGTQGSAGTHEGDAHDGEAQGEGTTAVQPTGTDRERTAGAEGERAGRTDRDHRDSQRFVERAAAANFAEIELGRLGAERAQHPEVKAFAQTMVDEHTKALEQLRAAARAQGLEVPQALDAKLQRTVDKLSEMEADRFDRAFMAAMVRTHRDTEKLLRKPAESHTRAQGSTAIAAAAPGSDADRVPESTTAERSEGAMSEGAPGAVGTSGMASPADPQQWAVMTLPKVRAHLEQARALERQVKDSERESAAQDSTDRDQP